MVTKIVNYILLALCLGLLGIVVICTIRQKSIEIKLANAYRQNDNLTHQLNMLHLKLQENSDKIMITQKQLEQTTKKYYQLKKHIAIEPILDNTTTDEINNVMRELGW